jgi:hypothetical protein
VLLLMISMQLVLVHDKVVSVSFFLLSHFDFLLLAIGMLVMYDGFCVLFH